MRRWRSQFPRRPMGLLSDRRRAGAGLHAPFSPAAVDGAREDEGLKLEPRQAAVASDWSTTPRKQKQNRSTASSRANTRPLITTSRSSRGNQAGHSRSRPRTFPKAVNSAGQLLLPRYIVQLVTGVVLIAEHPRKGGFRALCAARPRAE